MGVTSRCGLILQVLGDKEKRKAYDYSGFSEYGAHEGGMGGGTPFTTMRAEEIFKQFFGGDFNSIFGQEFGGGMSQQVIYCIRIRC